MFFFFITFKF